MAEKLCFAVQPKRSFDDWGIAKRENHLLKGSPSQEMLPDPYFRAMKTIIQRTCAVWLWSFCFAAATTAVAGPVEDELIRLGWMDYKPVEIHSLKGIVRVKALIKCFNGKWTDVYGGINLLAIPSGDGRSCWFVGGYEHLVLWHGKVLGLGWRNPATLVYTDEQVNLDTERGLRALEDKDKAISEDPRGMMMLRHYKGVFGLWGSRDISLILRTFRKVEFKAENRVLTFQDVEGGATLEINSKLDCIRSTVAEKSIDPKTVEVRSPRTLSQMLEKIEAQGRSGSLPEKAR